jgi:hypothetical protein
MEYIVGLVLGLGIPFGATLIGFDRDRAFYPVLTMVTASYYDLFAVLGGSLQALGLETMVAIVFIAAAIAGFKFSLWIIVAALAAHGLFDLVRASLIVNPGVPTYWPAFCLSFDLAAAAYLALLLRASRVAANPARRPADHRLN